MGLKSLMELFHVITWPLVVVIALLLYRKPLATFISGLGERVTKFSALNVSVELAALPSPPSPWSDPSIPQNSEMTGGEVDSTALMTLFEKIGVSTPWDYLIIDIKDGKFWLLSRVFIFTVFLQAIRGVKCVLFVESKNENYRRLIGLASADAVRTVLSSANPWLEDALTEAMIKRHTTFLNPSIPSGIAGEIIRDFIEQPNMRRNILPSPPDEWTQLGKQPIWEHTGWLTLESIDKFLRRSFYEWDSSHYKDTPDIQANERTRELIRRQAPFIALVNSKGEFKSLLDRDLILEQTAQQLS